MVAEVSVVVVTPEVISTGGTDPAPSGPTTRIAAITKEMPQPGDFALIFFAYDAMTLSEVRAVLSGGATPSLSFSLYYGPNADGTGATTIRSGMTASSTTTGTEFTSFTVASIPASNWVWFTVDSGGSGVQTFHVSMHFTA